MLLQELGWTMEHPRVVKYLARCQTRLKTRDLPLFVYDRLAKYLEIYIKCDRTLRLLGWQWNHAKVREIEAKHGFLDELTLEGYEELYKVLDEAWFLHGGGF